MNKLEQSLMIERAVKETINQYPNEDDDYIVDQALERCRCLVNLTDEKEIFEWVTDNLSLIKRAIRNHWSAGRKILDGIRDLWVEQLRGQISCELDYLLTNENNKNKEG